MSSRKLRLALIDYCKGGYFWKDCFLFSLLNGEVKNKIELNESNPDIVISCGFGNKYKNFNSSTVKIQLLNNEPWEKPDTGQFNYYIGALNGSVRNTSCSCYIPWWIGRWINGKKEGIDFQKYRNADRLQRKFCSQVGRLDKRLHREAFINALNKSYKTGVDCVNNSSYRKMALQNDGLNNCVRAKLDFIAKYKFNITFENIDRVGYITEKAIDPFLANTVPIYFGNAPTFFNDFECDARLILNGNTYQQVIEYVKYLDTHDEAYVDVLNKYFSIEKIEKKI